MAQDLGREREAAAQLQATYRDKVQAIRENADLSAEGRQRQIADLYASTKAKLKEHRRADQSALTSRFEELQNKLYVAPKPYSQDTATHAISLRDASDRAAQLKTAEEEQDLLSRALANNDDVLARAVVQHAMGQSYTGLRSAAEQWESVLIPFLDARPDLESVVEELGEIERMTEAIRIISPFSLPTPTDVPAAVVNAAGLHQLEGADA